MKKPNKFLATPEDFELHEKKISKKKEKSE